MIVYMVYVKKNSTMTKIEDAAGKLIFTYGVKGWNMDDCSREAGLTKRTVYQYIESKEQLIEHVLTEFIRITQRNLVHELSSSPDFVRGMDKMLSIFPEMIMKMESQIIQDIFISYPDIETHIIQKRQSLAEESLRYIRQAQQNGAVKKDVDAETILEIIQSFILYYAKNDPKNFELKLKRAIASVLYGILEPREGDQR